ncbi:MAG: DUF1667 domain-containing protein [Eubacteriaceae bacterium]|uniref:DUF1667 domain-containing protein n=1 Tax=Candidatus Pseudoramibacter fermentans TaxID=2594427 RepID=A0A6L5GPQ1_9FIRM|nr:DUF1667 domain-containing protein [Candidatus Pseudoramibacter fermentans]RRF92036.1 MAG: DUF1667 domain-containing protein [Eubacteriaceae bacterium]
MKEEEYTCIVCPRSCLGKLIIEDDGTMKTEGFSCKNGERYAIDEHTDPKRVLTTTVKIEGALFPLLPVVSSEAISFSKLKDCLKYLYQIKVKTPVREGDVLVDDILDTGVSILAARTML